MLGIATLPVMADSPVMNLALPAIVRHFDAGPFEATWLMSAYLLAQTSLLIVAGRLADVFGRRTFLLAGLAVFTAAALLAGCAPSVEILIGWRVVQAAGGAMILANSTAMLKAILAPERLGQGIGVFAGTIAAAPLVGLLFGGVATQAAGWRWALWMNVPLGLLALVWGAVVVPRVPPGPREPIDLVGAALLCAGLGGLVLGLSSIDSPGGPGSPVLVVGVPAVLLAAFAARQVYAAHPLMRWTLLTHPGVALGVLAASLDVLGRHGAMLLVALYLQTVGGMPPAQAGVVMLPGAVAAMTAATMGGFLTRRVRPVTLAAAGAAGTACALPMLALTLTAGAPRPLIALTVTLTMVGGSVFYTGNTAAFVTSAPAERLGVANGLRLTTQNVGMLLSVALPLGALGSALPAADRRTLYAQSPAAIGDLTAGYHRAFTVLTVVTLLTTVTCLANRARATRRRPGPTVTVRR
ncbi:MFS transporter [Thermomonospora umbrina]|uniref:MFS transporter n=1 Tax=Thermomonospora umbrina TaxID=111806 RepID=UPI000E23B9AA|nr:MFS transporter [Thermomonospora umbrina]